MAFDYEKFVPREKVIIYNDRLEASSHILFQLVREYFEPNFLLHEIEFGDNLCWLGFHPTTAGDEHRGWVRIESGLGFKAPGERLYFPLKIPRIHVGTVSIRRLSPVASRVLIYTSYTPEALSFVFNGLVRFLIWVVNGEDASEAWSRAVSDEHIKLVPQIDGGEVPLLEAPSTKTEQTAQSDRTPTRQTKVQKAKRKVKRRKTPKRSRTAKVPASKSAKQKIYVPTDPIALERYRKMWETIKKTRREYLHQFEELKSDRPDPTMDELREAIAMKLGKKLSEKTVRRVILAGSKRLLKKQ